MNKRSSLAGRIERELEDAGLLVVVEDTDEELVVTGMVDSEEERQAIRDIVREAVGDTRRVNDNIEVAGALPEATPIGDPSDVEVAGFDGAEPGLEDSESLLPGDFTDQLTTDSSDLVQSASLSDAPSDNPDAGTDGELAYTQPIDPIGTIGRDPQHTLDDASTLERSSDGTIGDAAIRDAVLQALREDAATTALSIEVSVFAGVVRLSGHVDDLEDAESAQEVAARVAGVVDVLEDLDVAHLS